MHKLRKRINYVRKLIESGQRNEALRVLAQDPKQGNTRDWIEFLVVKADFLFSLGRYLDSAKLYKKVLEIENEHIRSETIYYVQLQLGECYNSLSRVKDGYSLYTKLYYDIYVWNGNAQYMARAALGRAVTLFNLCNCYGEDFNSLHMSEALAIATIDRALSVALPILIQAEMREYFHSVINLQGHVAELQERYGDAVALFEKLGLDQPTNTTGYRLVPYQLARLQKQGDLRLAVQAAEKLCSLAEKSKYPLLMAAAYRLLASRLMKVDIQHIQIIPTLTKMDKTLESTQYITVRMIYLQYFIDYLKGIKEMDLTNKLEKQYRKLSDLVKDL